MVGADDLASRSLGAAKGVGQQIPVDLEGGPRVGRDVEGTDDLIRYPHPGQAAGPGAGRNIPRGGVGGRRRSRRSMLADAFAGAGCLPLRGSWSAFYPLTEAGTSPGVLSAAGTPMALRRG